MAKKVLKRRKESPCRFQWTPELVELLGKITDRELAKKAGIGKAIVLRERQRRGIPPSRPKRPPIEWTDEMIALLGRDCDRNVADELEIGVGSVYHKRNILGIPPYCEPPHRSGGESVWTPAALALLGTDTDVAVAKLLGVSPSNVHYRRQLLHIPPFRPKKVIEWTEEMTALLGTVSDRELADRFGVSAEAVRRKRLTLEIPAYRHNPGFIERGPEILELLKLPNEEILQNTGICQNSLARLRAEYGVLAPTPLQSPWTPETIDRLGNEPDCRIARDLGVSDSTVVRKRRMLGIEAFSPLPPISWTPRLLAQLGKVQDGVIARELGVSVNRVRKARYALSIQRSPERRPWSEDELALLGTAPDKVIAEQTGRSLGAVAQRRRALKMPASGKPRSTT